MAKPLSDFPIHKAPKKTGAFTQRKPKAAASQVRTVKKTHGPGTAKAYGSMYSKHRKK